MNIGTIEQKLAADDDTVHARRVEYSREQAAKGIWHEVAELRRVGRYLVAPDADGNPGRGPAFSEKPGSVWAPGKGHVPSFIRPDQPVWFTVRDGRVVPLELKFHGADYASVANLEPLKPKKKPTRLRRTKETS